MKEEANKILLELLKKATDGIDAAISFSQAQIPDVVRQLLLWNFVHSLIITVIAFASIPLVVWLVKRQCKRVPDARDSSRYIPTLVWDKRGEMSVAVMFVIIISLVWFVWLVRVLSNLTWIKIWLAPKLYLIEYAASLMK